MIEPLPYQAARNQERYRREFREFVDRLSKWDVKSWTVHVHPSDQVDQYSKSETRASYVFGLVQRLADLAADTEHQPRRSVPRLKDTSLADEFAVVANDILLTGSPRAIQQALTEVSETRRLLFS